MTPGALGSKGSVSRSPVSVLGVQDVGEEEGGGGRKIEGFFSEGNVMN